MTPSDKEQHQRNGAERTLHLLAIDDDELDIDILRSALNAVGGSYVLETASDGLMGLERLQNSSRRPDAVFLDLRLPRLNGFELLERIREDPILRPQLVFVMSTSSAKPEILRVYAMNAAGYIVKPLDFADFCRTVDAVCRFVRAIEPCPSDTKRS